MITYFQTGRDGAVTAAAASVNTHINMQPQVVLLTDVSDLVDGVKGAVDCRTSGGVYKEGHVALQKAKYFVERGRINKTETEKG